MRTQIPRSIYLFTRLFFSLAWSLATLPWHRMRAVWSFRRALKSKGLSRREVAKLTRLYRERSLKLRPTFELLKGVAAQQPRGR